MSSALAANHSLPHEETSKQPPRRTYGRKRAATPSDEPQTTLLAVPTESPSKVLLDRFSGNSTSWKQTLASLGSDDTEMSAAAPSSEPVVPRARLTSFGSPRRRAAASRTAESEDGEDDEEDMEAIKKEMERMRRVARGEDVQELAAEKENIPPKQLEVPLDRKLGFGSSSLTDLPASQLSSPPAHLALPVRRSSTTEDETLPVRRSGIARPTGRKRVVDSDEDEEDDADKTIQPISPSAVHSSPAPTLPDDRTRPSSPSPSARSRNERSEVDKQNNGESDEEDDLRPMDDFFKDLEEEDAEVEVQEVNARSPSVSESVDQYEHESRRDGKKTKGAKIRGLNQKDKKEMHRGIAETKRNRTVDVRKEQKDYKPISSWLLQAANAVHSARPSAPATAIASGSRPKPGLTFGRDSSPTTSPAHRTPDGEIIIPRSKSHTKVKSDLGVADSTASIELTSSPTTHLAKTSSRSEGASRNNGDDADDGDDDLLTFDDALNAQRKAAETAAQARRLAERKRLALQQAKRTQPESDDDLEIEAPAPKAGPSHDKAHVKVESGKKRFPDAKAVLERDFSKASPGLSKQRQTLLRHAGKAIKAKEAASETYVDFAGKAWDHAGMKNANGGAVPAGMKHGRQNPMTAEQLEALVREKHAEQARAWRKKKEEEYGRVRQMPARTEQDLEAMIAATEKHEPQEEEDSDAEDGDFNPDGDGEDGDDAAEDVMEYSGEEDEAEDEDDDDNQVHDLEADEEGSASKNKTGADESEDAKEEEEEVAIVRRKPRASNRIADDSDGEEATPRAVRIAPFTAPAPAVLAPAATVDLDFGDEIDLGGFGGSGDVGFSQLFEATQLNGGSAEVDAFAGLRAQEPIGLIPTNAMLPGVNISDTQAARDNALIAGEAEGGLQSQALQSQKKELYINEAGYFTQTKPADASSGSVESQWAKTRQLLAGASDLLVPSMPGIAKSPDEIAPSSTEKDPNSTDNHPSSPTRQTQHQLTRLRRRGDEEADGLADLEDEDQAEQEHSTPRKAAPTAFERMMLAQQRKERKEAAKKSNLVDAQAEESDDDMGWGPVGGGEEEDEEGDDEGYLPDLVDDNVVAEEEKKKQDELAAAKLREIEQADDAKREAEARKIIEGQHRTKKRGQDFFSDEEDDEEGGKRRKWSKKERKKRRLDQADGLDNLDGEENAFKQLYEQDLESDVETDDEPESVPKDLPPLEDSFVESSKPLWLLLRERAEKNRGKDLSRADSDLEEALRRPSRQDSLMDLDDELPEAAGEEEEESQFSIARSMRKSASISLDEPAKSRRLSAQRSTDSYAKYVQDESQTTRRMAGVAGVSVVSRQNSGPTATRVVPNRPPPRQSSTSSSKSGSVLLSKGNRFG